MANIGAQESGVHESGLAKAGVFELRVLSVISFLLGLAVLGELYVMFGNVVYRWLTGASWSWNQEIAQMALSFITFVGGAIAYARGEHMAVGVVVQRLPKLYKQALTAIGDWLILGLGVVAGVLSISVLMSRLEEYFVTLPLSQAWFIVPMCTGMFLLVFFAAMRLARQPRKIVLLTGAAMLLFALALWFSYYYLGFLDTSAGILWLMFILLAFLLLGGVPIGFILPACSLMYLYFSDQAPLEAVPQNMFSGIISVVLLAIPFFILAGYIMTEGGISKRLAEFAKAFFGHLRGGLLQVTVVCMFIVSGLSGSKLADVAAVGLTMKDMVKRSGYNAAEFTAVLASATVMGETIPPSIIMLVMASITSLSVGALFLAGIMPAVVIGAVLMAAIYFRSRYFGMESGKRVPLIEMLKATITALPALAIPVCLIAAIVSGFSTPTEASSTAVVFSFLLACIAYREMGLRTAWRVLVDSSIKSGMIMFIISAAFTFSWSLTVANLPHAMADLLLGLADMPWLFVIGTIVTLVSMGALLEGLPALMIFGPLLMPIAQKLGFHPLQFSMVLIISMGLGTFLPGIGIGMYVACAVSDVTMEEVTNRMMQYVFVLIVGLLLVAFVPAISLTMPHIFMK